MSKLLPYQNRWLNDPSRYKAGMFSRQTGKTLTGTLEIAFDCADAEAKGQRARWVILSRGGRQAREAMEEGLQRHLRAMEIYFSAGESVCDWAPDYKSLEVELPGGSRITALPANPDTARGFSANVLLDEFAFHQDSRKIWKALFPVVSKPGLRLRVLSTPNGKGNMFYDLMNSSDLDGIWSRHIVDIYQAVAEGLPRDIGDLKRGCLDDDLWAQEYELQWLDEASAWLAYDLINSAHHADAGLPEKYQGGLCFVGVDIATRKDLFVIWVLEAVGDVLWTREIIAKKRIPFSEQDALLDAVFQRYRVVRCLMDQTGLGEKPVEDAKRRYGRTRVEGVLFTGPQKLELATVGKEAFESRRIRINITPEIRSDLHKIQRTSTATGAPRFIAESDSEGHADRAWSCFLALEAARSPIASFGYTKVPVRSAAVEQQAPPFASGGPLSPFSRHGGIRGHF